MGFGAAPIGGAQVSNETGLATVAAAWDAGVRFYDTAPWYGVGRSERRLGLALAGLALAGLAHRHEYRINTKIGKTLIPEPVPDAGNETFSPHGQPRTPRDPDSGFRVHFAYTHDAIRRQHNDSLQRLGLSSVDSLTIHDIDYGYHSPEQIEVHLHELSATGGGGAEALYELRAAGRIAAIGCGCNLELRNAWSWDDGAHEDLCERIADTVDLDFFVVAGAYTLLETRALRRVLPFCAARRIGVIIAAPYASGWLAAPGAATTYMYGTAPPEIVAKSDRLQAICAEHGVPLAAAALQFTLAHPAGGSSHSRRQDGAGTGRQPAQPGTRDPAGAVAAGSSGTACSTSTHRPRSMASRALLHAPPHAGSPAHYPRGRRQSAPVCCAHCAHCAHCGHRHARRSRRVQQPSAGTVPYRPIPGMLPEAVAMIHDSVLDLIGGTPMVRLRRLPPANAAEVVVKLEGGNPAGQRQGPDRAGDGPGRRAARRA